MSQTDPVSPRMTSLLPNPFAPQWRELGERLALSAAVDLQRTKVRAVESVNWLLQRDREISATSSSYVRGEKKKAFSAIDLLIGEVGMVLACGLVVLGAGSEIPMTIVLGFFLLSAIVFSVFAKRAVEDLLSQVELEVEVAAEAIPAGAVS